MKRTEVNLDALEQEDGSVLKAFAQNILDDVPKMAETMFPGRPLRETIVRELANYALEKAASYEARLAGKTQLAREHDDRCETIYNRLPRWARW